MKGTTMRPAFRVPVVTALAAAALSLAGCGAMVSAAPSSSSPAASATASASPSPSASAGGGAGAGGAATPGTSPSPAPAAADVKTYTFPNGHVSFKYPADWKVELFTGSGSGSPSDSATATVLDASGTKQATVYSGRIADGVSHPVTRTVFESAPVPGLAAQPAPAAQYAFYVDRMDSTATYRMHLAAGAPKSGQGTALDGIIRAGDGVIVADVQFIEKPFANDAAAKSWLAGTEGQALKALLLSISYSPTAP